jgi:UPF0755 protein
LSLISRLLLAFITLVVALVVAALGVWASGGVRGWTLAGLPTAQPTPASAQNVIAITINKGENAATIGDKLQRAGVVRSASWFRLLAQAEGVQNDLAAGTYSFQRDTDTQAALDRIKVGITAPSVLVTIPEGLRIEQIADLLQAKGVTQAAPLLEAMQNTASGDDKLLASRPDGSLQGYLFPDTYYFEVNATPAAIIKKMLGDLDQRVDPSLQQAFQAEGLTVQQALTLASIVEREAQAPSERPIIASVFLNRLKQQIPLGADPTVQFALTQDPASVASYGWWKQDLTVADLKIDSPYNTYVTAGLPPGPICDPGLDSIAAVAHPAQTNYLYFVAKNDGSGSHAFATTLAEHEANIQKYQH